MINASQLVIEFVEGFNKDSFIHDWKTRSAVLYQLTVIGEAVKRLSREFRAKYPETPWALISGMRDNLIHGYDLIDWDEVWETSTTVVRARLARSDEIIYEQIALLQNSACRNNSSPRYQRGCSEDPPNEADF